VIFSVFDHITQKIEQKIHYP